jgi:hypothetical protein
MGLNIVEVWQKTSRKFKKQEEKLKIAQLFDENWHFLGKFRGNLD